MKDRARDRRSLAKEKNLKFALKNYSGTGREVPGSLGPPVVRSTGSVSTMLSTESEPSGITPPAPWQTGPSYYSGTVPMMWEDLDRWRLPSP